MIRIAIPSVSFGFLATTSLIPPGVETTCFDWAIRTEAPSVRPEGSPVRWAERDDARGLVVYPYVVVQGPSIVRGLCRFRPVFQGFPCTVAFPHPGRRQAAVRAFVRGHGTRAPLSFLYITGAARMHAGHAYCAGRARPVCRIMPQQGRPGMRPVLATARSRNGDVRCGTAPGAVRPGVR